MPHELTACPRCGLANAAALFPMCRGCGLDLEAAAGRRSLAQAAYEAWWAYDKLWKHVMLPWDRLSEHDAMQWGAAAEAVVAAAYPVELRSGITEIAQRTRELAARYRPPSSGVVSVDAPDVAAMLDHLAEELEALRGKT